MRKRIMEFLRSYRVPYNNGIIEGLELLIKREIVIATKEIIEKYGEDYVEPA